MTKHTYSNYKEGYETLLETMEIKDSWKSAIYRKAKAIYANKDKYTEVSDACGGNIPWYFIGVIHNLESGLDFTRHLHNGDPLTRRTRLIPAGRPIKGKPPFTFLESGVDALMMKGFHQISDWSLSRIAYELERYNGFGYRSRGVNSPYLWSGTNHYTRGKFIADKKYSASAVSEQIGCMPLIIAILNIDEERTDYDKVKQSSRRVSFTDRADKFITWSGLGTLASFSTLQEVRNFVTDNAGLILLGVAAASWLVVKYIKFRSKEEIKEGRYITRRK